MTTRAWYLGCTPGDVGDRAVLVGDRGRVALVAKHLDHAQWLNEDRGLTTVTGTYQDVRITVAAFGMGGPIAAVVLHELASLGVRAAVRLGTVMSLPPAVLGDLVLADGAIRREGTSTTYAAVEVPAVPDPALQAALATRVQSGGRRLVRGVVGSYDGFYTQMLALERARAEQVAAERARLEAAGAVGLDMETSAVLVVGRALGVRAASLCLATVDGPTSERMDPEPREAGERDLVAAGLDALAILSLEPDAGAAL